MKSSKLNKNELVTFLSSLITDAKNDEKFSIAWFNPTKGLPFAIIGGWQDGFDPDITDGLFHSASSPTYVMCVKIAVNEGPYAYTDFEIMNMPCREGEDVYDSEWILLDCTDLDQLAEDIITDYEYICKEYGGDSDEDL